MPEPTINSSGMDEIRQIFEAECYDGLDVIESGLLALQAGDDNLETVNDIFRGAHSIKGGAATFGYSNIADFTHVMETVLDRVRSSELQVSPPLVQVFLESVDCLRAMVETMGGGDYDTERTEGVLKDLERWMGDDTGGDEEEPETIEAASEATDSAGLTSWLIEFKPSPEYLLSGNQPQHIFRALAELGSVVLKPDCSRLPDFMASNPEEMYLSWDIELNTAASAEEIRAEFDWVENECEVTLTRRDPEPKAASAESDAAGAPPKSAPKPAQPGNATVASKAQAGRGQKKETTSIRVDIDKIDTLLNLVGEMVINQSMLNQFSSANRQNGEEFGSAALDQGLSVLERTTRELQEAVMKIRMLPVSTTFNRFPRLVYDLSAKLGKQVELRITGESTELDKTVLEKIVDPLSHLIRNSLDHGIESPSDRLAAGKSEIGTVHLSASHEGGNVIIRVNDDGAGLNTDRIYQKAVERGLINEGDSLSETQTNNLIFQPGFSTAEEVTDVSGRGVGMDVVRSNIEDIGGRVEVQSERGTGSTFQITLPLTLAVLDGQLVQVADQKFVIPLLSIVETVQVDDNKINHISGGEMVYRLRGGIIPMIDMRRLYAVGDQSALDSYTGKQLVIVDVDRHHIGLVVDDLLDQQQVVIKSLETNFMKMPGILGATILGDGTVSLIVDVTTFAGPMLSGAGSRSTH